MLRNILPALLSVAILSVNASSALAADGAAIFKNNCVTCHGENMDGNGPAGQYLNPKPRNLKTDSFKAGDDRASVTKTVQNGLPGTAMAGFGTALKPDEITAVVDFICSQRGGSCEKAPAKGKEKPKAKKGK
jgi:mono/diheme cytochrome c family protein